MNSNNGYNLLKDLQENNKAIMSDSTKILSGEIYKAIMLTTVEDEHIMVALTESNSKYKGSSNKPTQKNTHRTLSIASGIDEGELESLLKEATDINILEIGKAKYTLLTDSYSQEQTQEIMDKILPTETTNELAEVISKYTPKKRFFTSQRNSRMRNNLISGKYV